MGSPIPDRFFYHSFPRRRRSKENYCEKGLRILRSICVHGLLLVPEEVSWIDPTGTRPGDRLRAMQRRISFTELSPNELVGHAGLFGAFALEYDVYVLRNLGALPVIYVPHATGSEADLSQVGAWLFGRVADARQIIGELVATQTLAGAPLEIDLRLRDGRVMRRNFDAKESAAIQDYVDLLQGMTGQRLSEIFGALNALSSLVYPTEREMAGGLLGYYRQREWRLFSGHYVTGRPTTTKLTASQEQELLEIDEEFFARRLRFPDGEERIASKCHFMRDIGSQHVLSLARRIVVPPEAEDAAREILKNYGINVHVEGLEGLACG